MPDFLSDSIRIKLNIPNWLQIYMKKLAVVLYRIDKKFGKVIRNREKDSGSLMCVRTKCSHMVHSIFGLIVFQIKQREEYFK